MGNEAQNASMNGFEKRHLRKVALSALSIAFVFAAGCADNDSGSTSPVPGPRPNPAPGAPNDGSAGQQGSAQELQGSWDSSCRDADGIGLTQTTRLTFAGVNATNLARISSSGDCQGVEIEVRQEGTYSKGAPVRPSINAIDLSVATIHVKPLTERGAALLRLAGFCELTDWAVGQEREVTAATGTERCFPKVPTTLYHSYAVEGANLYFGKDGDLSNPANRPVELDRNVTFKKAP